MFSTNIAWNRFLHFKVEKVAAQCSSSSEMKFELPFQDVRTQSFSTDFILDQISSSTDFILDRFRSEFSTWLAIKHPENHNAGQCKNNFTEILVTTYDVDIMRRPFLN